MIELCNEMNLTILRGGLRSCPAFIGCYNEDLGTVCYANAGHTPGLLRDNTGITPLEATGLPLGLFSHTMQGAASCHLMPGSALLVVSRGIVEAEYVHAGNLDADHQAPEYGAEFGLDGVKQSFQHATALNASELCMTHSAGGSKVHPDDSHTQRPNDLGAGEECASMITGSDCSARQLARHATGDEPSRSLAAAGRLRARSIPGPPRTASQRRRRQTPECGSASSLCIMTRDNRSGKRSAPLR